MHQVD